MAKYYMQYQQKDSTYNVELITRTGSGARRLAKSLAKQDNIHWYDIVYKCADGRYGRLCNDVKRWA